MEIKRGRGRGGRPQGSGQRGKSNGGQNGKGRGKAAVPAQADVWSNKPGESGSENDDFATVRAAGFTGKPNSKKNRKRFGKTGESRSGGNAAVAANSNGGKRTSENPAKPAGNRHTPESRLRSGDNNSGQPGKKPFGKPTAAKSNNQHGADRVASAEPKGGRDNAKRSTARPGKKTGGWQGRKRTAVA
jgi:hypothetical protein